MANISFLGGHPTILTMSTYRSTLLMKGKTSREKSNNDITRRNERASKQAERRYLREVSEVLCTINVLCWRVTIYISYVTSYQPAISLTAMLDEGQQAKCSCTI